MCIVDIDANARLLDVNEAFERVTGYPRSEAIGRTTTELGLYADLDQFDASRRLLLAEGGYRDLEIRIRRKDGAVLTGLISAEQFFFSSRRRHTRCLSDWSSDVCSSD